jgi:hypothetical protein
MKKVDEYYCTNNKERDYLESKGFKYTFVKEILDTKKTTVWKYEKSKDLYLTLAEFYNN